MIGLKTVKQYCGEYWKIENYEEAINDSTQIWHCHHRFEIEYNLSKIELQAMGFYFNRPFFELIFLTPDEHISLHSAGGNNPMYEKGYLVSGEKNGMYGKRHTEETKQKIRATIKSKGGYSGENNPMYGKEGYWKGKEGPNKGKHHTEETILKITKFHISVEELYNLYIVQGLSQNQIAEMYGCSQACIQHKLKKYNIKK